MNRRGNVRLTWLAFSDPFAASGTTAVSAGPVVLLGAAVVALSPASAMTSGLDSSNDWFALLAVIDRYKYEV